MKMELRKSFQFEAAHLLPHLPKSHKCRRLHGHSFKAEIAVAGDCDPKLGWLIDYAEISRAFQPIWKKLDDMSIVFFSIIESKISVPRRFCLGLGITTGMFGERVGQRAPGKERHRLMQTSPVELTQIF